MDECAHISQLKLCVFDDILVIDNDIEFLRSALAGQIRPAARTTIIIVIVIIKDRPNKAAEDRRGASKEVGITNTPVLKRWRIGVQSNLIRGYLRS